MHLGDQSYTLVAHGPPKPACSPRLGGHASHLQALSHSDGRLCPWRPEAASTDLSEGCGGSLPSLHPKSTIQLWLQRQKARLEEKVRGGVEGGGRKSLSEEGLVGQLLCHHPEGA